MLMDGTVFTADMGGVSVNKTFHSCFSVSLGKGLSGNVSEGCEEDVEGKAVNDR